MTEKQKYLASIEKKAANGLRDVKFFPGNTFGKSEEAVYEELNRMHAATDLPDPEVLGKYSPALSEVR